MAIPPAGSILSRMWMLVVMVYAVCALGAYLLPLPCPRCGKIVRRRCRDCEEH